LNDDRASVVGGVVRALNEGVTRRPATLWIGMPVYNSILTVAAAIDSLLAQSYGDFVLFISDNASTDGTSELIRSYAVRDARIRHVRQEVNKGAGWNFTYVLDQADTEFYMWAAGDDFWGPDFIQDNLTGLLTDRRAVLSVSRTVFVREDGTRFPAHDTAPLRRSTADNVCDYLENPSTNSRFYGIHRRAVLVHAFRFGFGEFLAADWTIMVYSLCLGTHLQVEAEQFFRRTGGRSGNAERLLGCFRRELMTFFFPMSRFTLVTLRIAPQCRSWRLMAILIRINLHFTLRRFLPGMPLLPSAIKRVVHHIARMAG
jgi:glycosyltransferase involved in cell wall biosynthesis